MTPAPSTALVEVTDLHKLYGTGEALVRALDGVSLAIEAGEFVAAMGASGSGKSTCMNILGLLDRPTAGSYRFRGVEMTQLGLDELALLRQRYLGFVFQGFHLLPRTTALENVELPLVYRGVRARERRERAARALARVGLRGREKHTPAELSGGQQQRVAIARAIVAEPSLVLADEPTGNLDSHTKGEIMELLSELNAVQGITIVMVTHEPDMAEWAHRVITFRDGQIVEERRQTPRGALMMVLQSVRMALGSVRRNKLRSFLTMLGVVIGVGAVIAMVTLGQAASDAVTSDIAKMGQNLLVVAPGAHRRGPVREAAKPFTEDDLRALRRLPAVGAVAPMVSSSALIVAGNVNHTATVEGSSNDYFVVRGYELAEGRLFSDVEVAGGQPACILGATVKEELFGGNPALGATIRVKQVACRVIGVLAAKGASTFGPDQDDLLVMPLRVVQRRLVGTTDINMMYVSAVSAEQVPTARRRIEAVLRERRRVAIGEEDNFDVRDMKELIATVSSIAGVLTTLLGSIAAVSLLVGGIGIMNIMLVSVTERTKEVGLRLAIGARTADVLAQFLVEAVVLSLLGGTVGVALGLGGSYAATRVFNLPFQILPEIVALAFVFSGLVGIVFGYLPARKAARLNPIEALRHE